MLEAEEDQRMRKSIEKQLQPLLNKTNDNAHLLSKAVCYLQCNWLNQNQTKITLRIAGTAFLISRRILVTSAHNIYQCSTVDPHHIIVAPNVPSSKFHGNIYRSKNKLIVKRLDWAKIKQRAVQLQELCVYLLQKPIQRQFYFKVKQLQSPDRFQYFTYSSKIPIKTFGYPRAFETQAEGFRTFKRRQEFNGYLHRVYDHMVSFSNQIRKGCSGGPILACGSNKQYYVIGIQTSSSKNGLSLGLYFNRQITERLIKYVDELNQEYGLNQKISFYSQNCEAAQNQIQQITKVEIDFEIDYFYLQLLRTHREIEMAQKKRKEQEEIQANCSQK